MSPPILFWAGHPDQGVRSRTQFAVRPTGGYQFQQEEGHITPSLDKADQNSTTDKPHPYLVVASAPDYMVQSVRRSVLGVCQL
jgi:hypothetical protein